MSQANNRTTYINFHNMSELPIMIDSWVDGSHKLHCLRVGPGEKLVIESSVGEWHINSMLDDEADRNMWSIRGLKNFINLGKFRSDPCASGNYVYSLISKFAISGKFSFDKVNDIFISN